MSLSGQTMNPNSVTKLTISPAVAAPCATRHAPSATRRIVARDGSESSTASNPARSIATSMFRVAEPLGLDREARGLGLLGAERLHHDDPVDALVDHVRDVADEALCHTPPVLRCGAGTRR